VFERNLSLGIGARVFEDAFGGCLAGICGLGKKIGSMRFLVIFVEIGNLMGAYLFIESTK
jgi:hypothetical protein